MVTGLTPDIMTAVNSSNLTLIGMTAVELLYIIIYGISRNDLYST